MTQGKHTPGPWTVCHGDEISSSGIDAPDGTAVVWWTSSQHDEGIPNPADAVRIAAAVNACEGIPNEALEAGVVKDMLEALRIARAEIVALERDMETLLRGDFVKGRTHEETGDPLLVVEAAIARATGEKP